MHTIGYTVSISEYSGATTALSGSFTIEIACPTSSISYTEDTLASASTSFDLLAD